MLSRIVRIVDKLFPNGQSAKMAPRWKRGALVLGYTELDGYILVKLGKYFAVGSLHELPETMEIKIPIEWLGLDDVELDRKIDTYINRDYNVYP